MHNSLFVENHNHGIAFYINGDLQFDTVDEAIYHEYLVIPAISLAVKRFPNTNLRVLICGGGDGLAARDIQRFKEVKAIDLVDYNPEVLELAATTFKPYNLGSLEKDYIQIYIEEAFSFISQLPDNYYHVIICDFTYPKTSEETGIYSHEWFKEIQRILIPSGLISTNGFSPQNHNIAFWCLYKTLLSVNLEPKPLQFNIPSFARHSYGNWGFFLASSQGIDKTEVESIAVNDNLHSLNLSYLTDDKLQAAFIFNSELVKHRYDVMVNYLDNPQLFYYLLNNKSGLTQNITKVAVIHELPLRDNKVFGHILRKSCKYQKTDVNGNNDNFVDDKISDYEFINFLDIEESNEISDVEREEENLLNLESIAKFWVTNIYAPPDNLEELPDINKLLPARHHYHTPKMTAASLDQLKQLLSEIDAKRLLDNILERAQDLPPKIVTDLKELANNINSSKSTIKIPQKSLEFISLLSVTLLMANLVSPDSVFAKGYYNSGGSYSNGSCIDNCNDDFSWFSKFFGASLAIGGGMWLFKLLSSKNKG